MFSTSANNGFIKKETDHVFNLKSISFEENNSNIIINNESSNSNTKEEDIIVSFANLNISNGNNKTDNIFEEEEKLIDISQNLDKFKQYIGKSIFTKSEKFRVEGIRVTNNNNIKITDYLTTSNSCDSILALIINAINSFTSSDNGDYYNIWINQLKVKQFKFYDALTASVLKCKKNLLTMFPKYNSNEFACMNIDGKIFDKLIGEAINFVLKFDSKFPILCPPSSCAVVNIPIIEKNIKISIHGRVDLMYENYPIELKSVKDFNSIIHLEDMLNQIAIYQKINLSQNESSTAYLLLLSRETQEMTIFEVKSNNIQRYERYLNSFFYESPREYFNFFVIVEEYQKLNDLLLNEINKDSSHDLIKKSVIEKRKEIFRLNINLLVKTNSKIISCIKEAIKPYYKDYNMIKDLLYDFSEYINSLRSLTSDNSSGQEEKQIVKSLLSNVKCPYKFIYKSRVCHNEHDKNNPCLYNHNK